LTDEKMRGTSR